MNSRNKSGSIKLIRRTSGKLAYLFIKSLKMTHLLRFDLKKVCNFDQGLY